MPNWRAALTLAMTIAAPALAQQPKPSSMVIPQAEFTRDSAQTPATKGFLRPGDTWTYRLTERWKNGKPRMQSSYVVKVKASSGTTVLDEASRNGAASVGSAHSPGRHMLEQVVSVFSPYLVVFEDLKPGDRIWYVNDDSCSSSQHCWWRGRVEGRETLELAAGTFDTIKVTLDQNDRKGGMGPQTRTLTIWYSQQARRAVKVTSRVSEGSWNAFRTSFDLELLSYNLQSAIAVQTPNTPDLGNSVDVQGPQANPTTRFPRTGDTWTYRLTEWRSSTRRQSSYVVKVKATPGMNVLDEVSRDGAGPGEWMHSPERQMVEQVVSVFSPYLVVFEDLKPGDRIERVTEHDDYCEGWLHCSTTGRVEGRETLELAAGTFDTIKVTLDQNISKRIRGGGRTIRTRILTIWYSPQAKRAVKVTSRVSHAIGSTPFHASFDLDLMSYKLQ